MRGTNKERHDIMKNKTKKNLNAQELLNFLHNLQREFGYDLAKIKLNYRYDHNSDVRTIASVEEDLYDAQTNRTLTSLCFVTIGEEQ